MILKISNYSKGHKQDILWNSVFRIGLEVFMDILFAAVYNLRNMSYSTSLEIYSLVVACIWLTIFWVMVVTFIGAFVCMPRKYTQESIKKHRFRVLLEDLKENKKVCMLEHLLFMLRRAVLVWALVFLWGNGLLQIIIFMIASAVVIAFKLIVRPYEKPMLNLLDVLFEMILFVLCSIFVTFHDEKSEFATSGSPYFLGIVWCALFFFIVAANYVVFLWTAIREYITKRVS